MECLITYKFEEIEILSTIRLGIGRIIVVGDRPNVPSSKIFKNLGIEIEEKASKIKPGSKIGEIVHGVLDMISSAREKGNEPIILLPHDRRISIGMYIAACIEKTKIIAVESGEKIKIEEVPIFPFVALKYNELFVLNEIFRQKDSGREKISTKSLFSGIKRNENIDMLYTSLREPGGDESVSVYRQLLRILDRLKELNLVEKYEYGRSVNWELTEFGEIFQKSQS